MFCHVFSRFNRGDTSVSVTDRHSCITRRRLCRDPLTHVTVVWFLPEKVHTWPFEKKTNVTFYNKLEVRLYEHDWGRGKWHVNRPGVPLPPPVALLWRRVVCPINQRRPSTTPGGGLSTVMFVLVYPLCSKTLIKQWREGERRDVYLACKVLMPTATTGARMSACIRKGEIILQCGCFVVCNM
jgi:hypothetical protein